MVALPADEEEVDRQAEHKIWMQNCPLLYDYVTNVLAEWPSLTCQWMPDSRLLLGTHSNGKQDAIIIANVEYREDNGRQVPQLIFKDDIKHQGSVNRARYMPQNHNIVASQSSNASIFIYNIASKSASPYELKGQQKEGYGLSWNYCKEGQLLSASYDGGVFLYDTLGQSGDVFPSSQFRGHRTEVEDVSWHHSSEHTFASVGDDAQLLIWDTREQNVTKPAISVTDAHDGDINSVSFSPKNPSFLITGGVDKAVNLWDLRTMRSPMHSMLGHDCPVMSLQWSPFSETILASACEERVHIWDLERIGEEQSHEDVESGTPELIFSHAGHLSSINDFAWNPSIDWSLCSVSSDNCVHLWRPSKDVLEEDDNLLFVA